MKLFGHPVHALLIHFPTALLPMELLLAFIYSLTNDESFYKAGCYCMWAGAISGIVAMITGLVDLLVIPRTDKKAIVTALYHGSLNGTIILVYFLFAYKSWQQFPMHYMDGPKGLVIKSILILLLFIGNYLGGKLIYQYHIGILKNKNDHESIRT